MENTRPLTLPQESIDYVASFEKKRASRNSELNAVFLPLEMLTDRKTNAAFLAISMSATGDKPLYLTKNVSFYRIAKVAFRWFVVPTTISKLFTKAEFESQFSPFIESATIDGEEFWQIPAARLPELKAKIDSYQLNNDFREIYLVDLLYG